MVDSPVFTGPLTGFRILEIGSIGPGPFGAMLLADLGADVIRIDRAHGATLVGPNADFRLELLHRGRRSVAVDLKRPGGAEVVLSLVERADALLEGFRPGVTERLGIGPDACLDRNPGLVYGRITGYGQDGPMAQVVGHDINYVAQSGVLSMVGRYGQPPTVPLSLVGDFGGGGYPLALGVLAALLERTKSGQGQVVDAAMVEGAAVLGTPFFGFSATGAWRPERGTNLVDYRGPVPDCYQTADGKWLSLGALEPQFYADLIQLLDLPTDLPPQYDQSSWPALKPIFAAAVRRRTRDEWLAAAVGLSPCVAAVLGPDEAPEDPHNAARGSFVEIDGVRQPAPVPKFSRTPATVDRPPPAPGEHTVDALTDWGIDPGLISSWMSEQIVVENAEPSYALQ